MRFILVMLLVLSGFAHAGCGSINNDDQRAYCYVKEGNGSCASIKDDDLRATCYVEVGNGSCVSRVFCKCCVELGGVPDFV
ncbi:hypothetical protein [Pseudomonas synxantha]|uniref:Lipoprotein n=1 Tax=Pseudomonas synxantha TaxID=47883 RepID=A0AAU8TUX8_9PSED|nr:hypothetical protein [Pseudomonas synxantha]AKA86403.1 hypothetical protein VO64_5857 [Pseudomonas synxantha]